MTNTYKTFYSPEYKAYAILSALDGIKIYTSNAPVLLPITATKEGLTAHFIENGYPEQLVKDIMEKVDLIVVTVTNYVL